MPPAIAALVLAIRGLSLPASAVVSLVFGAGFIFSVMSWMRAVGTDAWLAMCAVEAAFFLPLGIGLALALRGRWWPLWTAVWWVAVETWRAGWPFSGMPFGRLAYASADSIWAPGLPWLGMTGVSLVIALTGTTLAWVLTRERNRVLGSLATGVVLAAGTAAPWLITAALPSEGQVTIAAVQGDVPGTGTDMVAVHREVTQNLLAETRLLADSIERGEVEAPTFAVWPENSTAVDPFLDPEANTAITDAVAALDAPILVGAMVDSPDPTQVLNQGIVWRPHIGPGDRYTKLHPVPYGEYIPFRGSVIPDNYGKLRMIPRDMVRGTSPEPLRIADVLVANAICFDVAYDDGIAKQIRSGAQLITVQTSNAMFINTAQIQQQFEISRLRAIEAQRWVVVAAINGVSGIISPNGEVITSAEPRTRASLVASVDLFSSATPASQMGVWPGRLLLALAFCHAGCHLVTYLWRRGRGPFPDLPKGRCPVEN